MATVTHYIYSHYDPKDRERLEAETGQIPGVVEEAEPDIDPWQTESSFGVQRRIAAAPSFVPAEIPYDQLNEMIGLPRHRPASSSLPSSSSDVAGWYRSLARSHSNLESQPRANTAPPESAQRPTKASRIKDIPHGTERRDKNNWFIARALRSGPSTVPVTPPSTLADILAREPPPSSDKERFKPPVFLALGPANKGWTMLQQSGWSEGEGLGATVARRADSRAAKIGAHERESKAKSRHGSVVVKQEERESPCDSDGEISEVRKVDIVDLTLSDSDDDYEETFEASESQPAASSSNLDPPDSHTTPLLTPIATVLKSDRLGIGLKAKTVGPYKASKKRVTHNQAALAAHIRANEEMRRLKAITGRGSRAFARLAKKESEQRRQLLASLNAS